MKVNIGPFPSKDEWRKIEVRIDKYDTWNMDHTLALIIYPMLLQLRDTKPGVPGEFADVGGEQYGVQDSFDFYQETHNESFDKGCENWNIVMDKMIWSFEQLQDEDYSKKYYHGEGIYDFAKTGKTFPNPITGKEEATFEMIDLNPDEHWVDYVGLQAHEEQIQEGLNLFGKYFRSLWD